MSIWWRRAIPVLFAAGSLLAMADDRAVAEWVIRQGGRVILASNPQPVSDLPQTGELSIIGVDLYGTIIEPKDLEKLSGLSQIRELYLPGPSWNPGAGSRLDANDELKFLAPLKTLEKLHFSLHFLTNVNVQDKGLQKLESLPNLKELRLAQGRVKNFSFAIFPQLEGLDLSYSTATDEVLKSLAGLRNLRRLNLRDTLVTDEGLAHLAAIRTLEEIDLYGLKISDRGVSHLAALKNLRKLNLLGGPVTDAGAEVLAALPHLRELNLYRAEITNAGLSKLAALRELRQLDIRYTRATASGVEKLRAASPDCRIEFSAPVPVSSAAAAAQQRLSAPAPGSPDAVVARWLRESLGVRVEMRDARIQSVHLNRTAATDAHMAVLAALPALEDLDLEATEVGDLGLAELARCQSLRKLRLDSTTVSDRGLAQLASLRKLEVLSLGGTLVRTLAALPPGLTELDLGATGIEASGALPHVTALRSLRRLNLAYTNLSGATAQDSLAGLPATLRILDLTGADIEDRGLAAIATLTQLEELLLNHGRFTAKGLSALTPLIHLRRFEAVRTAAGEAAAQVLQSFQGLQRLNLDYTPFNDAGLKIIASLPLVELHLDSANITDAGVESLLAMKSLRYLNLYHTLVSEEAYLRLVRAMPQARIVWDRDSKLPNRRGS